MRLARLQLANFRCFKELDLQLASGTVLIGANNSGKSTILEAIHHLCPRALEDPQSAPWASVVHRAPGDTDALAQGPVMICGTFVDLNDRDLRAWRPVLQDGELRFGRLWQASGSSGVPYLVLDVLTFRSLVEAGVQQAIELGSADTGTSDEIDAVIESLRDAGSWVEFGSDAWIGLDDLTDVFTSDGVHWPGGDPPWDRYPTEDWLVEIGTPGSAQNSANSVLTTLLRRMIVHQLTALDDGVTQLTVPPYSGPGPVSQLTERAFRGMMQLRSPYVDALRRYLPDAHDAWLRMPHQGLADVVNSIVGEMDVAVARDPVPDRLADRQVFRLFGPPPGVGTDLSSLGSGAQRAAAIAALELYRDPDLWPPDESIILLIEEPESGLHPAAQRRVPRALSDLPAYGVQTVIATHSPIFVNSTSAGGLRLVRAEPSVDGHGRHHRVVLADGVDEIARELGVQPSDVLLARRFLIVEGAVDAAVLTTWARTLGNPLRDAGVQVVPAGGHTKAERVAQFLSLAYEGASFVVVLDNGSDTPTTKAELEARLGARVSVELLPRTEVEAFSSPRAVASWLVANGAEPTEQLAEAATLAVEAVKRKQALGTLSRRHLDREYRPVEDGSAIAGLMIEADIHPDIKTLLYRVIAD
jgi:energy-coupling factor transporter ATP-binding protein EcfA2